MRTSTFYPYANKIIHSILFILKLIIYWFCNMRKLSVRSIRQIINFLTKRWKMTLYGRSQRRQSANAHKYWCNIWMRNTFPQFANSHLTTNGGDAANGLIGWSVDWRIGGAQAMDNAACVIDDDDCGLDQRTMPAVKCQMLRAAMPFIMRTIARRAGAIEISLARRARR